MLSVAEFAEGSVPHELINMFEIAATVPQSLFFSPGSEQAPALQKTVHEKVSRTGWKALAHESGMGSQMLQAVVDRTYCKSIASYSAAMNVSLDVLCNTLEAVFTDDIGLRWIAMRCSRQRREIKGGQPSNISIDTAEITLSCQFLCRPPKPRKNSCTCSSTKKCVPHVHGEALVKF